MRKGSVGSTPVLIVIVFVVLAETWALAGGGIIDWTERRARTRNGVIKINQKAALAGGVTPGDAPGFPVSISVPGSYVLTGNLTTSDRAISVLSSDVSLDLNGFTVSGEGTGLDGISLCGSNTDPLNRHDFTVRNGVVRAFRQFGIFCHCSNMKNVVVESVQISSIGPRGTASAGVACEAEAVTVRDSQVYGGSHRGIVVNTGALIIGNVVSDNGGVGIVAGDGSRVSGNTVRGNESFGLDSGIHAVGYADNVFSMNNGGDSMMQVQGGVDVGGNLCGGVLGCS